MRDGLPQLKAVFGRAGCSDPGLRALAEPPLGVTGNGCPTYKACGFNETTPAEWGGAGQGPPAGRVGDTAGETRGREGVGFSGPLLPS